MILLLNKPQGQTPLECIQEYKQKFAEFHDTPMTYAGRLDPMAEGLLLVLGGDEIVNKDKFLGLDKTYEVEFMLGFSTDTYDLLGLAESHAQVSFSNETIETELKKFLMVHELPTPPYSSKPINGKSLFKWARENKLSEIEIPTHPISVKEIIFSGVMNINGQVLLNEVVQKVSRVSGDFRQTETIEQWKKVIEPDQKYNVYSATLTVSSGTYIRAIIQALGQQLGTSAVVYSLKRTSVGNYTLPN